MQAALQVFSGVVLLVLSTLAQPVTPRPAASDRHDCRARDGRRGGASDLVIGAVFKTVGRTRERASVGFDSHTPPPTLLQNRPLDKLSQHCRAIFRFDQAPQIFAINWHDTQTAFAVAQHLFVQGLGESFGAD